ncbi:MAG: hypothetical protein GXP02_06495 [Alphaproteobacteria bacterium]|nr:hypothetical protein [Alphaproteobacteria bacterium]
MTQENTEKSAEKNAEKNAEKTKAVQASVSRPAPGKKPRPVNLALWVLAVVMVFILGSATVLYFLPTLKDRLPILAKWVGDNNNSAADMAPLTAKIARIESRLDQQSNIIQTLQTAKDTLSQRLDALSNRLSNSPSNSLSAAPDPALLARLTKLEQAVTRQTAKQTTKQTEKQTETLAQSARIDMLLGRISQLEASFVPLSKGLAEAQDTRRTLSRLMETTTAQSSRLDQLAQRLEAGEAYAARDNNGALLAFRISDLRRRITAGQAYGPEIAAVETMVSHGSLARNDQLRQSISWLGDHKAGVVPPDRLRAQFDALIPAMIRAKSTAEADPWWQRAYHSIKNLVIIRRTDISAATGSDNIIATVRQMLARHDLKMALSRLKQLPDTMQNVLRVWRLQATTYLQAGDQINNIASLTAAYYLTTTETTPNKVPETAPETTPAKKQNRVPDQKPGPVNREPSL